LWVLSKRKILQRPKAEKRVGGGQIRNRDPNDFPARGGGGKWELGESQREGGEDALVSIEDPQNKQEYPKDRTHRIKEEKRHPKVGPGK